MENYYRGNCMLCYIMALCRSILYNFPFPRHSSPHYHPLRSRKIAVLPLRTISGASSSMETPPEGYRRNVGICLMNPSKKIFAASRLDIPESWQMPQGGIDETEDPRDAAIRELREETGVTSAEILAEAPYWLTYDFPKEVREKLKHQWGSERSSTEVFTGKEEEINLSGDRTEKPEFRGWSWMSPEQVVDLAVDFKQPIFDNHFKQPIYKEVLTVFSPHLQQNS